MKIVGIMILTFALFLPSVFASEIRFDTHTFMPSLQMNLENNLYNGTPFLDLKRTLDIQDISTQETKLYFNDSFRVSYLNLEYEGKKPLLLSKAGDLTLNSDLGLKYWSMGWFAPLKQTEKFSADLLIDVKSYKVNGQLGTFFADQEILSTEKTSFSGVAPTIGIALAGNVDENLQLYGEVSGLPMGSYGALWEFDAGIKYKVKDRAFMQVGYKSFDLTTSNQLLATTLKTKINGPYFGINFSI